MGFITGYCTDKGNVKEVNQDALLIKTAHSSIGDIALIAVCDGVGGLEKGELASSRMIRRLSNWFHETLPEILSQGLETKTVFDSLNYEIITENEGLRKLGSAAGINLGTTLTGMLIVGMDYYVVHVGDTRLYEITDGDIVQITNDQTLVAYEVSIGRLSQEDAEKDSRSNILMQGIGATKDLKPEFISGKIKNNAIYVVCCDGFRHKLSPDEIKKWYSPRIINTEEKMMQICAEMVDINKQRLERDNITVVALRVTGRETC